MKKQILFATTVALLFCFAAVAFAGRAHAEPVPAVDVAFSPAPSSWSFGRSIRRSARFA